MFFRRKKIEQTYKHQELSLPVPSTVQSFSNEGHQQAHQFGYGTSDAWHHQIRLIEQTGGIFRVQESIKFGAGQEIHLEPNPTRYSSRADAMKAAEAIRIVGVHKI